MAFGASYSGALSAWLREKYPNNFWAALASSAVVGTQLNYYQYLETVNVALLSVSLDCQQSVNASHQAIRALARTKAGRASLAQKFG